MKLKEIHRTSTFAWSPTQSLPLLATGTVAGALDESFSNESKLEIWAPDFLDKHEFDLGGEEQHGPKGVVSDTARFFGSIGQLRDHFSTTSYLDSIVCLGVTQKAHARAASSQQAWRTVNSHFGIQPAFSAVQSMFPLPQL